MLTRKSSIISDHSSLIRVTISSSQAMTSPVPWPNSTASPLLSVTDAASAEANIGIAMTTNRPKTILVRRDELRPPKWSPILPSSGDLLLLEFRFTSCQCGAWS